MSPTNTTASEQQDRIQEIIDALNEIPGIEFAEDAWEEKAPNNYGVVELTGEAGNDYADGIRIAKGYMVEITIYVTGGSHAWIEKVEAVLDALKIPHTMPQREYLFDIKKVSWRWQARIRKSITRDVTDEETSGADDGGDDATTSTDTGGGASGAGDDGGDDAATGTGTEPGGDAPGAGDDGGGPTAEPEP